MDTVKRLEKVTLREAYEHVKQGRFGRWRTIGNYMKTEFIVNGKNVETVVFLGESIFILGLSVEIEGTRVMASGVDFVDIWPSVEEKYPQLFQEGVYGELCLIL